MTTTIEEMASGSVLSQVAYKDFPEFPAFMNRDTYIEILTGEPQSMTDVQAEAFADRYVVRDQLGNTASGFSGTVFYDTQEDRYTFAMRGTEFTTDILSSDMVSF